MPLFYMKKLIIVFIDKIFWFVLYIFLLDQITFLSVSICDNAP